MAGGSRKKSTDKFASMSDRDTFGMIYQSMCTHEAFLSLSVGLRLFYMICRVHAQSRDCKQCLYKHGDEFGKIYPENYFVFPASHSNKYGYKRSNASRMIKDLITAGFIDEIENNKHMKKVNVYAFSSRWKGLDKPSIQSDAQNKSKDANACQSMPKDTNACIKNDICFDP